MLAGPLPSLEIPATLHDSLMARLDRLAPVKEVAQIGACIGREFDRELLASVVSMPEAELAAALDRLVAAELVSRRGTPPAVTYVFKHALVRDAAYESLLKKSRQELHERIAASAEARFPQIVDAQPELVAHHYSEAGLAEKAIPHWLSACRLANARSANREAIAHARSGLECVQTLAPGPSRSRHELSLQLALGGPILASKGFASDETEAAYKRAEELSRELGSEGDLFAALRGLNYVYHVRGNLREAAELAERVGALARRSGHSGLIAEADHLAAITAFHRGQFRSAREILGKSPGPGAFAGTFHAETYGFDVHAMSRGYIGHCDWHLGYPARALKAAEEGLAAAKQNSRPFGIALAFDYLALLHQFRREPDGAFAAAQEAHSICADFGFDYYGAWSRLVRAWAIAESGRLDDGLAAYKAGLEEFRRTNAGLRISHHLGLFASLHGKAGKASTGLRLIDEAIAIAKANDESWRDAELHRERGELLLLAAGAEAEAQADAEFQQAVEISAAQGARMPELRASVARARLRASQGRQREARNLLTPIYDWFGEGLDTRDLLEAKSLLADLR